MADKRDRTSRRTDATEELELSELSEDAFEPTTGELELTELEPMPPPPPPAPGLGLPGRQAAPLRKEKTLHGLPSPDADAPSTDPELAAPTGPRPETPAPPKPSRASARKLARPKPVGTPARTPSQPPPVRSAAKKKTKARRKNPAREVSTKRSGGAGHKRETTLRGAGAASREAITTELKKPAPDAVETAEMEAQPTVGEALAADLALRDLCEAQLGKAGVPPDRVAQLHFELGRLFEFRFQSDPKGAEHYQLALRARGDHAAALGGARRTLARLGRYPALPPLYDAEIAITREPKSRARLLYQKGRLLEDRLEQRDTARSVYQEALGLDPGNLVVLKAIERSLRRDRAWGPLVKTYEHLANAAQNEPLRAAWTAMRAHITETKLGDPVQAAVLYEAALDTDPHATSALANVKRLGTAQKRWPQLVDALLTEHALCDDAQTRVSILLSIARIEEQRMGDADAAVETLGEALKAAPTDPHVLRELARLHRAGGRHTQEIEALAALVETLTDKDEKARHCHRVAHLYEQMLSASEDARPWFERTLRADPSHRAAALALVRIHEQAERWSQVIAVWETRADNGVQSQQERAELHHKIGNLYERERRDPVTATRHHAKALGLDPDHHAAFDALCRLYGSATRWQELAELLERAVERAPHDEEAIMWLFRLGAVREDRLSDPRGAIAAYDRILERDPDHRGALHAIVRAGGRAGEHKRVVQSLQKQASLTKDPARSAALLHRAAALTARELGDPAAATRALEALLKRQPQHRASLESLAVLLSDAGRWRDVVGVYRRLLPLTSAKVDQTQLQYRIGEILEIQVGDLDGAIRAYRAALAIDPDFEPARGALIAALRRGEAWTELAAELSQRVDRLPGAIDRARAATELGELYETRLDDNKRALEMYQAAIDHSALHRPALDARERLLIAAGRLSDLADALASEVTALQDPFLRMQTSLRSALVRSEQPGEAGPALDAFRPVFEQHPEHLGALLAVESIYARTNDEGGLVATFAKMAEVLDEPKAKLSSLKELVRARRAAGSKVTKVMRSVLRLDPNDTDALEHLARHAFTTGDSAGELKMHARLASTASDPRVGAFHQARVGELLLSDHKPHDALSAFQAAIALDATSLAATRGLSRAALLAEDPRALRQAARRERDVTQDRRVAVGLLLRAALVRLTDDQLGEAVSDYESALTLDPENVRAAAGLRATLGRPDQAPQLIDRLGRAALACVDPARAAALHRSVAELHAEVRGDLVAAVAATRRALEPAPDDLETLFVLADYLERSGSWDEAIAAFDRVLPRARGERMIHTHLRIARVAETRLRDPDRAIRSLRAVLDVSADNEEALGSLVRLERVRGRHDEALKLAKQLINVVSTDGRRAGVLTELAELERDRGQPGAAAANAFSALGIQGPTQRAAVIYKALIASAPSHATWDNYATGLMTFIERNPGAGDALSATYRELAWVFGEASHRPDRAIATLREGVAACPREPAISLALVKALRDVSANDQALVELRRFLTVDPFSVQSWRGLAELFRATGEPDGAAIALAPVVASKRATDAETKLVRARRPLVARAPGGILGRQGLEQIIDNGGLGQTAAVLVHAMTDVLGKLEPFDPERYGLTKRDRVRQGEPHPVRAFADRIGMTFGVPEYELYMVDSDDFEWACAFVGNPPTLVVPTRLETVRDPVLAFHLARPLAMMSRLLHPVDRISPVSLERILVAATRQFEPTFSLRDHDPELEGETKRVGKAIGFFARSRVQEAAIAFGEAPTRDIAKWVRDVRRMAARAALLVSDDLLSAYEALGADHGTDDLVADLARFWVSDPAMRFRRRVAQQL